MVGCLLLLRLHAFLSLIVAAFVVCLLTPPSVRQWQALRPSAVQVQLTHSDGRISATPTGGHSVPSGAVIAFERVASEPRLLAEGILSPPAIARGPQELTGGDAELAAHPTVWLAPASAWNRAMAQGQAHPLELVGEGFGATCAAIGLMILLASVIGACLTQSGAADRIVGWILEMFGERRAPQAFAAGSFLLGIPVFFDTIFYLMLPLGRGLAARTGRNFLLYTLSIVAGATMAHSLVPPTPGPLFAAKEFGVSLGAMMIGGMLVGGFSVTTGWWYAIWANRRWPMPARSVAGSTAGSDTAAITPAADGTQPPPLLLAVLPIVLPVLLIGLAETWKVVAPEPTAALRAVQFLGQGTMPLLLGTGAAIGLLVRRFEWRWQPLKEALGPAVTGGGVILLITAAGGAFGAALRQTDVASQLTPSSGGTGLGLLTATFVVTALVRSAQGSATVAMLTASGVMAPVALAMELPFHPVYLALAVGCGSKPVPWMNDSGFWIIGRMSGMSEVETLKTASVMMSLMGCTGFLLVLLGAWLLPLK